MKTVLITGGNRGIGFFTAKLFAEKGYDVILTARNEKSGIEALEKLENPKNIYFHTLDISSDTSVKNIGKYINDKFGKIDIIINNAAINYDTW